MDVSLKYNRQMRSLTIAMATATCAAVGTMFIPAAMLETITAAPLGNTARALIAFGASALILTAMTMILLGTDSNPFARITEDGATAALCEDDDDPRPSLLDRFALFRLPTIGAPKWPWQKGEYDITEFANLPKLRGNDIHPDAPPRRPLSATSDLPELDLVGMQISGPSEEQSAPVVTKKPVEAVLAETIVVADRPFIDSEPLIADMVAQLEAAVAQRQRQLIELEAVAAQLTRPQPQPAASDTGAEAEILLKPVRLARPAPEAVLSAPPQQDDMDEALVAALATLHRMNSTGR